MSLTIYASAEKRYYELTRDSKGLYWCRVWRKPAYSFSVPRLTKYPYTIDFREDDLANKSCHSVP